MRDYMLLIIAKDTKTPRKRDRGIGRTPKKWLTILTSEENISRRKTGIMRHICI